MRFAATTKKWRASKSMDPHPPLEATCFELARETIPNGDDS